jgi:hypothetical protein
MSHDPRHLSFNLNDDPFHMLSYKSRIRAVYRMVQK